MTKSYKDENVYWQLLQVAFRAKHGLMQLAEKHDLTVVQLHTLGIMQPGEAIPMNTISCMLLCDASNVTGIVDRLLAQEYIERIEKPEDRRVKMISLTSKGIALRRTLLSEMTDYELPEFQRLNSSQLAQLKDILGLILQPPQQYS